MLNLFIENNLWPSPRKVFFTVLKFLETSLSIGINFSRLNTPTLYLFLFLFNRLKSSFF